MHAQPRPLGKRLLGAAALLWASAVLGCAAHRAATPHLAPSPTPEAFVAWLDAGSPAGDLFEATLYIEFAGGFLGERKERINGQAVLAWPDRARLIGAYGAFKKLFDLAVNGSGFELYDPAEHVLYVGAAFDSAAATELGLAARPGDLPRLLRLGGRGPLEGAMVEGVDASSSSHLAATFRVPGDSASWIARYDVRERRLDRLERRLGAEIALRVDYGRYREEADRAVPFEIVVTRPGGNERVRIEVRSITFKRDLEDSVFRFAPPKETVVQPVGAARKPLPGSP